MATKTRQPIRVLVVDDEQPVREAYQQILGDAIPSADRAALQDMRSRLFRKPEDPIPPTAPLPNVTKFRLDCCEGAEAAVEACRAARIEGQPYAVVFLDMRMPPGRDGVWAAEQIRALDRDIEIVICTAFSDVDPATLSERVPPADKFFYLQKPFHPHEVRQLALALGQKWSAEQRISRLAYYDNLTGLPNRALFQEQLSAAIEIAKAQSQKFAILYFDLDNFKRINDTLGHGVGDELLCELAGRLSAIVRCDDVVGRAIEPAHLQTDLARLGGDEFVILVNNIASPEDAGAMASRIEMALRQSIQLSMHEVFVTTSIGIATYPADGADMDTLFRNADLAMYFAKRQGLAQIAYFNETMSADGLHRLTLEGKLRDALKLGEFKLHYQPQFDLSTGAIQGFEALLRWSNAELGPVSPKEFIPVAETTGLILPIGEWVLRAACAQMKAWLDAGLASGMRVAVNVSGLQFAQHNFPELVAAVIHESGLPPACVELEITESMVMRDEDWANHILAKLKALGVLVAIDDFGTGYSSLSRLRELSVDRLKIDQSFVKGMQSNGESQALVSAIIRMAGALGVGVVAEGVEDFAQLLLLQDEKCGAAQGFLLGRPLAAVDAEALMKGLAETRDMGRTARLHKTIEWPQTANRK